MKSALLDLNVLIALAWPTHVHHTIAHEWFTNERQYGWATCPITQIGFVRLSSNPKLLHDAVSPAEALHLLHQIIRLPNHQFWEDSIAVTKASLFTSGQVVGYRQITDVYLLSLAIEWGGRLVTFDKGLHDFAKNNCNESLRLLG